MFERKKFKISKVPKEEQEQNFVFDSDQLEK